MHFFTDDPKYRQNMTEMYSDAFEAGIMKTGPTEYDSRLAPKTSAAEGAKFKRCTDTVDAAVEFTAMALCDAFIGTAGSTVTYYVRALNKRYAKPFDRDEVIGDWHVPDHPTMRFRNELQHIVNTLGHRMKENVGVNITHAQANVLDFLTDSHLQEMHEVLTKHLEEHGGSMLGSRLGDLFLRDCAVARLNKKNSRNASQIELETSIGSRH